MGYVMGTRSTCSFCRKTWSLFTAVHGDDFLTEGPADGLAKKDAAFRKAFHVRADDVVSDEGQVREARVLIGIITWESMGITGKFDPEHVDILLHQLRLFDAKPLDTPGVRDENKKEAWV